MIVILLIFVIVFVPLVMAVDARIWTDKDDYGPNDTVTTFGEGFLSNTQVTIEIMAPDSSVDIIYAWTNNSGAFFGPVSFGWAARDIYCNCLRWD